MNELHIPNFGELLAPYIDRVPGEALPNFLALLERGAADRYRGWAEMLPAERAGLLACANREDEIADRAEALFPLNPSLRDDVAAPLPEAKATYYRVFLDLDVYDQLRIQADAERQGAAAWRAMISDDVPKLTAAELEAIARLEETSADYLDALLATAP